MTDIRRTLLWVVFTMSLVLLWDAWNRHTGQPSWFAPRSSAPVAGTDSPPAPVGTPGVPSASVPPAAVTTTPAGPATPAAPARAERVTITTDLLRATIDSRGGDVVRLELLNFKDDQDPTRPVVLFDESASRTYLARTGLATVHGVAFPNHETPMAVVAGPRTLGEDVNQLELRLESPEVGGVKLVKVFTFERGRYTVDVRHEVINVSAAPVTPHLYLQLWRDGNPPPGSSSFYSSYTGPAVYTPATNYEKVDFSDIEKGKASLPKGVDNGWIAMVQHYFVSAWLVNEQQQRDLRAAKAGTNLYLVEMVLPLGELAPGATKAQAATLYAGPQEEYRLEKLADRLDLVKDYGWLTVLAKPLFWLLTKLHGLLGNWGWAIVALVVLLKAAFYWLNAHAYRSMAKMKAINPRVMELRERHKDKPQQMQQEMMRIYREEKVNPLGGCLPIVVQIPFFIALYWVLLSSVEMRNAPWIGWVHDLSARDPYFILPILMTASTLLQTWLAPTPPDPTQAKMMWIMPLVFSGMFFVFPAGLVLYWLTNNILSIAQQWHINKRLGVLGK